MPALVVFANEKEDSLIANIGKKAKVVFYAEKKADLDEIAKYDLNKLFAEVRKRSDKNFSNTEEVTLREADELKNRQTNTTITPRKWLKNMNLNLFVGATFADGGTTVTGLSQNITIPQYGKASKNDVFTLAGNPSFMFGIGGTFDKQLYRKGRIEFSLRYGFGFDLISSRLKTSASIILSRYTNSRIPYTNYLNIIDSLKRVSNIQGTSYKNYFSPNFCTQIVPTFNILNRKGEKMLSVGIGLKASINFAGLSVENRYINPNNANPNFIYPKYRTLQTAIVANIGYKYANLFIQMQPDIGKGVYFNKSTIDNNIITNTQGNFSNYIIGLRFGK